MKSVSIEAQKDPLSSHSELVISGDINSKVKKALYAGEYALALKLIEAHKNTTPISLDLICDEMLCLYQLGLLENFERHLELSIQTLYALIETSPINKLIDQAIFLSKLSVEVGRFDYASDLLELLNNQKLLPEQSKIIYIQKLRLYIESNLIEQAKVIYPRVALGPSSSQNFEVEREHALLIADAQLFGLESALDRFLRLVKTELCPADHSFLQSEMLDILITKGAIRHDLQSLTVTNSTQSVYEDLQIKMVKNFFKGLAPLSIKEINNYESQLGIMSQIRLIAQAILLSQNLGLNFQSLSARYQMLCEQIYPKNLRKFYLNKVFNEDLNLPILICRPDKKSVQLDQGQKVFIKPKLFWDLLALFSPHQQGWVLPIDQAVKTIYQEIETPHHFDRLRIAIYRLNNLLSKSLHLPQVFSIAKSGIKISVRISVESNK